MKRKESKTRIRNAVIPIFIWLGAGVFFLSSLLANDNKQRLPFPEAIEIALRQNPALSAVQWQRQAAEYDIREARSEYLPQIVANAGYTRFQEPNIVTPIHEPGKFPPLDDEIYESNLQLKMPIFDGFRTSAKVSVASATAKEAQITEQQTAIEIIRNISEIYIRATELADNQQFLNAHLQALHRRHYELSLLGEEGRVSSTDLALAESAIDAARSDSLELEYRKSELAHRLGQLLGSGTRIYPEIPDIQPGWSREMLQLTAPAEPEPDGYALAGPTVQKAQAQLDRAKAFRSYNNRTIYPDLSGFALYSWRAGADRDPIGEWAVGITVSLPLFQGGKRIAAMKSGAASVHAAQQGYLAARQQEQSQLQIAYERWQNSQNRQNFLKQAVENKQKSVEAQRDLYKEGRMSLSELLIQENELLNLRIQERALVYQEISALLDYHATAGTLTTEKVQSMIKE